MVRITNGALQEQIRELQAVIAEMQERMQPAMSVAEETSDESPEQMLFQIQQETAPTSHATRPKIPTKLPSFKGKRGEDVRQWLFQIENICRLHGHPIHGDNHQLASIAGSAMEDPASGWYLNWATSVPIEMQKWENFRLSACRQFEPTNYQANLRKQLQLLKQVGDIEDYNGEFSKLVFRVEEMSQVDQISYYVSGLKRQSCEYVQLEDPLTLLEAMDLARKFETSRFRGSDDKETDKPSSKDDKNRKASFATPVSKKPRTAEPNATDEIDEDKKGDFCKFCKKPGHLIEKCRKLHAKKAKEALEANAKPNQS